MADLMIFSDGSVQAATGLGFGAYLMVPSIEWPLSDLAAQICIAKFANTSSTRLELQTLLHALSQTPAGARLTLYTDSQNIIRLPSRRERLEALGYCSKRGKALRNNALYRQFFALWDERQCRLVKLKGHCRAAETTRLQQVFACVDKAARQACRET